MSFAAGFGESFSKTFGDTISRNATEREDQFKMIYEEYLHRRQMFDEQKIADTKMANKAKAIVQSYGGTVPPEAWTQVYNWLQAGTPDDQIADNLHRGKFDVSGDTSKSGTTPVPPDSGTKTPSAITAAPSNDGSTGDNSMTPGTPPSSTQPPNIDDIHSQTQQSGLAPKSNIPPSGNGPVPPADVPSNAGAAASLPGAAMDASASRGAPVSGSMAPAPIQTPAPPPAPVSPQASAPTPLPGTLAHAAMKTLPPQPAPQAQPNMSNDMSQSLSQVNQSPVAPGAPPSAPQGTVSSSNPIRAWSDRMYNDRMQRNTDLAKNRISAASGLPSDQVDHIMSSIPTPQIMDTNNLKFTPGPVRDKADEQQSLDQIAQERALAAQRGDKASVEMLNQKYDAEVQAMRDRATVEADANYTAQVKPAQDALVAKMAEPVQAHRDRVAAVNNAIRDYNIMSDTIEKTNGDVLSESTANRSDKAQEVLRDITTTVKQGFDSMGKAGVNVPQSAQNVVNQLEAYRQKLTAPGGNGLDNLAVQRGLFDIQKALFAFHLAQAEALRAGNRGLSVDQLNSIQNLTTNALNPDEFHQGMADALGNAMKSVETEGQETLANNPEILNFKQQRGFVPSNIDYDLIKKQDEATIQKDPDLAKGYARLQQYSRDNPTSKANQDYGSKNVIQNQVAPNAGTASSATDVQPRTDILTPDDVAKLPKGTPFIIPGGPNKGKIGYAQ